MNVGVFADGVWGFNLIKLLHNDKSFKIDFVVLRQKIDIKILKFCKLKKIKYFNFKNINSKKSIDILKKFQSDIFVSMSYNQIFKNDLIKLMKKKIINCHAGALPYYRGRSPINWALINGEKKLGITTHFVNSKIDQGDILDQKFVKIKRNDNFKTILEKCYIVCPMQIIKVLKKFKNNLIVPVKQSSISIKGSYYFKRKEGDEVIDFNSNYNNLRNFIKALVQPSIGATFFYDKIPFIVTDLNFYKKYRNKEKIQNGTIINVTKKKITIKISDAIVNLNKIFFKKNYTFLYFFRKIFKKNFLLEGK